MIIYDFWYDYVKQKYDEKSKLCYMYTDSFIAYMKTNDIYKDIPKDIETRLRAKSYSYLIDDGSYDKNAKDTRNAS